MKRFYCILFLSYNLLSADDFQAQVQPASFSLQQSAYLTVSTAQSLSQVEFDLPQSQQFQLRYESQSSQTRYINGAMERSTTWFFRILASGPGTFNIPQFQCHSQGKTYTIPATSFTVLSETPKAGTESTASPLPEKSYKYSDAEALKPRAKASAAITIVRFMGDIIPKSEPDFTPCGA